MTDELPLRKTPRWIFVAGVLVVALVAGVFLVAHLDLGAPEGLPPETYSWHPALAPAEGRLEGIVRRLPLGELEGIDSYHPLDPPDRTGSIELSNVGVLSAFLTRQREAVATALGRFRRPGAAASSFAYLALLPAGRTPASSLGGRVEDRWMQGPSLVFVTRTVQGLVPSDTRCVLSVADGFTMEPGAQAGALDESLDYVLLAGSTSNLYVELAVTGRLDPATPEPWDVSLAWKVGSGAAPPLVARPDWEQEPLRVLRAATHASGLGICTTSVPAPTPGQ